MSATYSSRATIPTTSQWEPTIGLEIHARLATRTKAFCACEVTFAEPPNSRTCPICLAYPGTLPVLNADAVRLAVRSAVALRCSVSRESRFDRKNYFYPDLPKGYQITQADAPLAVNGWLEVHSRERMNQRVRIERIHIEEDAGRSTHSSAGTSGVDLNRAGAPLIEIVTRPDLSSPADAASCFSRIRQILLWAGTCDGNMEEGSIRCDANVSIHRPGEPLGTRVEIKNLNSFRFLAHAVEFEIERQIAVLESGGTVSHETRLYDPASGQTRTMRSKEDAPDYRFFPEPDLPPLECTEELTAAAAAGLPLMPDELVGRYVHAHELDPGEAEVLASTHALATLFERTSELTGDARAASNWIRNDVVRLMKERAADDPGITAEQLSGILKLTTDGTISVGSAREVLARVWSSDASPEAVVEELGLAQNRDAGALTSIVTRLIESHPEQAAEYRAGRTRLLGFFVGLAMKQSGGTADPRMLTQIVRSALEDASD